jgi:hypothetical protein
MLKLSFGRNELPMQWSPEFAVVDVGANMREACVVLGTGPAPQMTQFAGRFRNTLNS